MTRANLITVAVSLALLGGPAVASAQDGSSAARDAAHDAVREALLERAALPPDRDPATAAAARVTEPLRVRREQDERAAHERAAAHGRRHSGEARLGHGAGSSVPGAGRAGEGGGGHGTMDGRMDGNDPAHHERTRGMRDGGSPHDGGPHR